MIRWMKTCEHEQIKYLIATSDLTVNFTNKPIYSMTYKSYGMIGLLNRNFTNKSKQSFITTYQIVIRPHLEYAAAMPSPIHRHT